MGAKKLVNNPQLRVVRNPITIANSKQAYDLFTNIWDTNSLRRYESCYALFLSESGEVLEHELLNIGTRRETPIDVRRLFGDAYLCNASAIILAHNHPSGNSEPSEADIELTKELEHLCKAMDYHLADHLILGRDGYFSFRDGK